MIDKLLQDLLEATKAAYKHLDSYGVVSGGHEREIASQQRVFDLLRPAIDAAERFPRLSKSISPDYPPNKHRALAQQTSSCLMSKGYLSTKIDFVGEINELEKFFAALERDGLIKVSDQFYQD